MGRKLVLPSILIVLAMLFGLPGCMFFGGSQSVMKSAWMSAIALPDYDVSQSQLDAHPGAVPFKFLFFVESGYASSNTSKDEDRDLLIANFSLGTDGLCYTSEIDEFTGDSMVAKDKVLRADDVTSRYSVWMTDPQESTEGSRTWYRHFPLDSSSCDALITGLPTTLSSLPTTLSSSSGIVLEDEDLLLTSMIVHNGLLVWEIDPNNPPEFVYAPVAPLASMQLVEEPDLVFPEDSITVEPEPDIVYDFFTFDFEASSSLIPFGRLESNPSVPYPNTVKIEFEPQLVAEEGLTELQFTAADIDFIESFLTDKDLSLAGSLPDDLLWTTIPGADFKRASDDSSVAMYDGFSGLATYRDKDMKEGESPPQIGDFEWTDGPLDYTTVLNIPVDFDSIFSVKEPHLIELPYTFWYSIEYTGPPVPSPDEIIDSSPDTEMFNLRVIVTSPRDGHVTLSTPDGDRKYDYGPEGTWQSSMAFDWFFLEEQEVTLTARPLKGYRFVAWESDFYEIQDPHSPVLKMKIIPPMVFSNNPRQKIIRAYFAPIHEEEPPQESASTVPITGGIKQISETIEDESGCRSIVSIDYEATDHTGGEHLVSDIQLKVDGTEVDSWSGIPVEQYKDDTLIESGCGEIKVIQLKATNENGDSVTVTKEARIPPLSTYFSYGFSEPTGGEDCKVGLDIDYQVADLTATETPITHVVVTANGDVWFDSGTISTDWLEGSISKVVNCGSIYRIHVDAFDAEGNTFSYRHTINVPKAQEKPPEEPPDEPPDPPPVQTTLYGAMASSAQCTASGPECNCQFSISFDGKDLTVGSYPVTRVILTVNGSEWHNSGSISQTNYHKVVTRTVDCGATFNMVLTVENSIGQVVTVTGSLTTPIP